MLMGRVGEVARVAALSTPLRGRPVQPHRRRTAALRRRAEQGEPDSAPERMAQERDRFFPHIEDLLRTRETLDALVETARAYRERWGTTAAG